MIESYPLYWPEGWKRTEHWRRERSKFKTGFGAARNFVFDEIRRMGGTKQILSTNVPLRNDGLPRANTPPTDGETGVAVYFTYRKKDMVFACDKYFSVADNIYAIALTIEALRGIERWGASDMLERAFRGFAALPEKASSPWRDVLGFGHDAEITGDALDSKFRQLVQLHHPDKGGDPEKFQSIIEARRVAKQELSLPEVSA
jgi:hypothetical protein